MVMALHNSRHASIKPEKAKSRHVVTERSHVLIRMFARSGQAPRSDSGRLMLEDDVDVPDILDSEFRGR
jgi:hypothetical protein